MQRFPKISGNFTNASVELFHLLPVKEKQGSNNGFKAKTA